MAENFTTARTKDDVGPAMMRAMARKMDEQAKLDGCGTKHPLRLGARLLRAAAADLEASTKNREEAWAALGMIREALEEHAPPGTVRNAEHIGSFQREGEALTAAVLAMAGGGNR